MREIDEKTLGALADEQMKLARKSITTDDAKWATEFYIQQNHENINDYKSGKMEKDFNAGADSTLAVVAGLDATPVPGSNPEHAVASIVVMSFPSLLVLYEDDEEFYPTIPYIPSYLGFREVPAFQSLLKRASTTGYMPQVLLVDGFGMLHPRGCGSATQLGVLSGIPTIGVAKNLLKLNLGPLEFEKKIVSLPNVSYLIYYKNRDRKEIPVAAAVVPTGKKKAIYVSVGHRLSLQTCINITLQCCKYRIPEPIRLSDHRSRAKAKILACNR